MKRIIFISAILTLGCHQKPVELSDACKQLIERHSFYSAIPLAQMQGELDSLYNLENFRTAIHDSEIQTIDFECVIAVNPTTEQLMELQKNFPTDYEETVRINSMQSKVAKCIAESKGIRFVEATSTFLRLRNTNQTWDLDVQKGAFPEWRFILFNKEKTPVIIPNANLTIDKIDSYFETGGKN